MSKQQDLIKQLESSPEAEILGVVSAGGVSGAGGSASDKNSLWTVLITLSGWRPVGGRFRESELVIRKEVSDKKLKTLMAAMDPYDVVRVRARLAEENVFGFPEALLIEFIGKDESDNELNSYAAKLQEPVTLMDPEFGVFTLERRVNWYEANPVWCGAAVRLTVPAGSPNEIQKSLAAARKLWADQEEWHRRITAYAVQKLLELKNDNWLDEGEAEVSEEEFGRRMVVETISVNPGGSFEFWHDDGDLFLGHSIMVSGNLKDGPKDAGIHG